jgi:hypothetical protein
MKNAKNEDKTADIWQVADGDVERHYSNVFFHYGVMLIGGGWLGDYRKRNERDTEEEKNYKDPANEKFIRQFFEAGIGNLVVLKRGLKAIAVGEILEDYDFKEVFSDVEGFDLRHCRRVKWTKLEENNDIDGLSQNRFCRLKKDKRKVKQLWEKNKQRRLAPEKLAKIPINPEILTDENLVDSLTKVKNCGRRNAKLIADTILRLRRLANWYEDNDTDYDVKEHETRTFLVIPLIMSLGWVEENVKIEWHNMDVVLFDKPYTQESKPVVIIETKRLWHGLGGVSYQATDYAKKYPKCDRLVITNGIRYMLYSRPKQGEDWPLTAYLNLLTPTRNHPYEPGVGGAISFFQKMIPNAAI